ncbi:unnamed protein product [Mytilus coruscus]|uniref:C-type lectin domain-containing protein n=1 Tax=Mytilus coruscus TaxID=42192 RepID=A0A6J8ATU2_MYTCO|nr:unnamed protein product [Mytilus coruscus]
MITLRRNVIVKCSLLLFYLKISFSFAQKNVKKRDFVTTQGRRILPSSTTIMTKIIPSYVACAALCSKQGTCCCASYDRSTKHCNLDESCCPQIEPLQGAIVLKNSIVSLSCQSGWHKYENNCYYFSEEKRNWSDAGVTCKQYGSMLAEVKSSCENDYLKSKAAGLDGTTKRGNFWSFIDLVK